MSMNKKRISVYCRKKSAISCYIYILVLFQMNLDVGPYEAGLGFFIKLDKVCIIFVQSCSNSRISLFPNPIFSSRTELNMIHRVRQYFIASDREKLYF